MVHINMQTKYRILNELAKKGHTFRFEATAGMGGMKRQSLKVMLSRMEKTLMSDNPVRFYGMRIARIGRITADTESVRIRVIRVICVLYRIFDFCSETYSIAPTGQQRLMRISPSTAIRWCSTK